jgi:general secretion pathway protein K
VATLWIVALLALAAAVFAGWVASTTESARLLRQRVAEERTLANVKADVVFMFITSPLSPRGLEVMGSLAELRQAIRLGAERPLDAGLVGQAFLALDDRPYLAADGVVVRLQDARGLINLNFATREDLLRLLDILGVDQSRQDPMIAKLKDYVSPGEFVQLHGAKREEYAKAGRPPPPNAPMRNVWEARRVLTWDTEGRLWAADGLPAIASASAVVGYNLNTAPAKVLQIAAGMTEETAAKAVETRRSRPFLSFDNLVGFGAPRVLADPIRFIMFPSDTLRVTFELRPSRRLVQMSLTLTPISTEGPWRIDYLIDVASVPAILPAESDAVPEFPDPATILAAK